MVDDPLEIDEDRRRYLDEMVTRLRVLTHYEALGIARASDRKAIKRAYFSLAAVLHPDRYFGKKLGPYKAKLEAVFARVTLAYETLYDRDRRAAYDLSLPPTGPMALPETIASGPRSGAASPSPVDPAIAAKRKEAMAALQVRFVEAAGKVKGLTEAAARARAAGDLAAALDGYRQALVYAPTDAALRAAHDETKRLVDERLAASQAAKARLAGRVGNRSGP